MPLFVIATPIGHLGDVTQRLGSTLASLDLLFAEDTRRVRQLAHHLGVTLPATLSLDDHQESSRVALLLERLAEGGRVGIVSDAGTPCIADPGFRLVRSAREAGYEVVALPGPCALTAFLSIAGLPTDRFTFGGFVPRRQGERQRFLERALRLDDTFVCYEAPHRLLDTLDAISAVDADRLLVVGRELTKRHEEVCAGVASLIAARFRAQGEVRGELVLGWAGAPAPEAVPDAELAAWIEALRGAGLGAKAIARVLGGRLGLRTREVYAAVLRTEG